MKYKFSICIVLATALAATAQGATTLATGDLGATRDYLDVREIAGALLLLSRADTGDSNGIVNICSGTPTRIRDLLDEILRQLGMNLVPVQDAEDAPGAPLRHIQPPGRCSQTRAERSEKPASGR